MAISEIAREAELGRDAKVAEEARIADLRERRARGEDVEIREGETPAIDGASARLNAAMEAGSRERMGALPTPAEAAISEEAAEIKRLQAGGVKPQTASSGSDVAAQNAQKLHEARMRTEQLRAEQIEQQKEIAAKAAVRAEREKAGAGAAVETKAADSANKPITEKELKTQTKEVGTLIERYKKEGKLTKTDADVFNKELAEHGPQGLKERIMDRTKGITPKHGSTLTAKIATTTAVTGGLLTVGYEAWEHRAGLVLATIAADRTLFHGDDEYNKRKPEINPVPGSTDQAFSMINPKTNEREVYFQGSKEDCEKVSKEVKDYLHGPVQNVIRGDLKTAIKNHPYATIIVGGALVLDTFIPGKPFSKLTTSLISTTLGSDAKAFTAAITTYGALPIGGGLLAAGVASLFGNDSLPDQLAGMIDTTSVSDDAKPVIDRINGNTTSLSTSQQNQINAASKSSSSSLQSSETELATAQSRSMQSVSETISPVGLNLKAAIKKQGIA